MVQDSAPALIYSAAQFDESSSRREPKRPGAKPGFTQSANFWQANPNKKAKRLSFASFYFSESGLFNGLRPKNKKSPPHCAIDRNCSLPAPRSIRRRLALMLVRHPDPAARWASGQSCRSRRDVADEEAESQASSTLPGRSDFDIDQRSKLGSAIAYAASITRALSAQKGPEMTIRTAAYLTAGAALAALTAFPADAQSSIKVGTLTCDISAGIGMIITQKQTMTCAFSPVDGGPPDKYIGRVDQFGLALGEVRQGTMVWGVIAPASGIPHGALAGTYGGVGAQATAGAGLGANVLVGGTGRAFSLQPLTVQGQTGLNFAAGVTTVTLTHVQ